MTADIKYVQDQIKKEYYTNHRSLKWVLEKYSRYDKEEVLKVLGIYDLEKQPVQGYVYNWFTASVRKEWDDICRKLNPKAWAGRE